MRSFFRKRKTPFLSTIALGVLALGMGNFLWSCSHGHSRSVGMNDVAFDVSPIEYKIVFAGEGSGGRDLYLLDVNTSTVSQLTSSADYESDPSFSPDGKTIVYAAGVGRDRADHIFLRSLDGKRVRQLTNEDFNDHAPSFALDGKSIVFARNLTYNWGGLAASWGNESVICVLQLDGSKPRQLTDPKIYASWPKFSPDGKKSRFRAMDYISWRQTANRRRAKSSTTKCIIRLTFRPTGKASRLSPIPPMWVTAI